jgi:hypothetical protein
MKLKQIQNNEEKRKEKNLGHEEKKNTSNFDNDMHSEELSQERVGFGTNPIPSMAICFRFVSLTAIQGSQPISADYHMLPGDLIVMQVSYSAPRSHYKVMPTLQVYVRRP